MTVSDNSMHAKSIRDFFKSLCEKGLNVSKKMAKNVLSNPTRALDNTANIATAAASGNPKIVMKTLPELMTLYHTGKGLYLGKFVKTMLHKWNKKQKDYTHPHRLKKNIDLEQRLEKKTKDVNSFGNHMNNNKEMITDLKDKNHKSKTKYKNYKTLNAILEAVDTIAIIGATSNSLTLSITGIGLNAVLSIYTATAGTLSLGNKVLHKIIIIIYKIYKKQYGK